MTERAENKEELQQREAIGIIRASRFVRKYAQKHQTITEKTICAIHRQIFREAWPEIAGVYRIENLKIRGSKHLPPHYSKIPSLMQGFGNTLVYAQKELKGAEGRILNIEFEGQRAYDAIDKAMRLAAWAHHQITFIHPFRDGNGRTARLVANLILERYALIGISIKVEKENKNRYRQALAQIDNNGDFEPLLDLMTEGIVDRYHGVVMKYYEYGRSKKRRKRKRK